ncbi:hypothetical protein M4I32_13110 [Microbacterium sp. LRZ72]|uniref:hypothetical protein n=1 Tax=Microbacterium sp. LRZ72 TaxID=2942481 RepID=UPI0029B5EFC2|nr:hypothetical protein [Microbacterium sp. LRZ72]MDX2377742.1 hypothetical protein [Microbacterium sp. LRZ72]
MGGGIIGLVMPEWGSPLELVSDRVLGLPLYATFLNVPFTALARAFRDWRFLLAVLAVNFVILPLVVFGLSRFVAHA